MRSRRRGMFGPMSVHTIFCKPVRRWGVVGPPLASEWKVQESGLRLPLSRNDGLALSSLGMIRLGSLTWQLLATCALWSHLAGPVGSMQVFFFPFLFSLSLPLSISLAHVSFG